MVMHELKTAEPVLDVSLFKNATFALGTIISAIIQIAMFVINYMFPIYIQNLLGKTPLVTGLVMLPAGVATALGMFICGKTYDKYGERNLIIVGLIIMIVSSYAMNRFAMTTPFANMIFWLTIRGAGLGLALAAAINIGMIDMEEKMVGTASSLGNVSRTVATSFGIAVFTNIMQARNSFHYANLAQNLVMSTPDGVKLGAALQGIALQAGLGTQGGRTLSLYALYQYIAQQSAVMAIGDCYIMSVVMLGIGLILTLFLRGRKSPIVAIDTTP